MYTFPAPSTATAPGVFNPAETRVVTVLLVSVHFLMEVLPVSTKYMFPAPSTAAPLGLFNPDASVVTCRDGP